MTKGFDLFGLIANVTGTCTLDAVELQHNNQFGTPVTFDLFRWSGNCDAPTVRLEGCANSGQILLARSVVLPDNIDDEVCRHDRDPTVYTSRRPRTARLRSQPPRRRERRRRRAVVVVRCRGLCARGFAVLVHDSRSPKPFLRMCVRISRTSHDGRPWHSSLGG